MPFTDAGHEIDPFGSVPMAISTIPEATATAEPELDPHGFLFIPYGLMVWPPRLDHPLIELKDQKLAHSERFVLPKI
jgi:hypothetical protein